MTEDELGHEKSSRIGKFQVDLASNSGLADAIDAALYYGFGIEYLDSYPSRVAAVTREQANEALPEQGGPRPLRHHLGGFVRRGEGAAWRQGHGTAQMIWKSRGLVKE